MMNESQFCGSSHKKNGRCVLDKKSLLLVCGNKVVMDIKIRILERAGYTVRSALGCDQARELLKEFSPDGIILESAPLDGCGIEFLRELNEQRDVPIMFLSDKREDEVDALQAGAYDFLRKPYNFDVLLTRVHMMINRTEAPETMISSNEPGRSAGDHNGIITAEDEHDSMQDIAELVRLSTVRQKGFNRIKYRHIAGIVACVAVILAAGGAFLLLNNSPQEVDLGEGQLPLAGFPFADSDTVSNIPTSPFNIRIAGIEVVNIQAGATDMTINLVNAGTNQCNFVFELVLRGTSEVLYRSVVLPPGEGIQQITLHRSLEKGDHSALLVINTYSLEDNDPTGCIRMEITITAE